MAITGVQISDRVGILLNDTTLIRWTAAERLIWINDGRREMAERKPEIFGSGSEVTHTVTAGAKQRIGTAGAYKLVSVDSNAASGRSVRLTSQDQLDAFLPEWRSADIADDVQNWFPDKVDLLAFWIYPQTAGTLNCHVYITPTDLTSLTEAALPYDQYEPTLVNYIMFRAYSKENEAGSADRAVAYKTLFDSAF